MSLSKSSGSARDSCNQPLSFAESAKTLITDVPALAVTKQVRNATFGGGFGATAFAGAGDTLAWRVVVQNNGPQRVTNLFVEDQLPSGFSFTTANPTPSSQTGSPPLLKWHQAGGQTLAAGSSLTYLITGTVASNACSVNTLNVGRATYGCSTSDICLTVPVTAGVAFDTKPVLTVSPQNATIDQCSGGPVIINFANNATRAQNVVVTYTLPSGVAYNGLAPGACRRPVYQPAIGATGTITWMYSVIGTLVTTNTLRFNVKNAAGVCAASGVLGPNVADIRYQDTCGTPFNDVTASTNTLTVQKSNISATQTPLTRAGRLQPGLHLDDQRSRTPATRPTNNLVVTETLGNGWGSITAVRGNVGGTPTGASRSSRATSSPGSWAAWPPAARGPPPSTAVRSNAATNYRTTLTATTSCADGGCLQTQSVINYASALNSFTKTRTPAQVKVGDLVTFTVTADLFGNVTYSNVFITDTLPTGLGYVSAALRRITDRDGDSGGPTTTTLAPTSAPAANASGNVVWNLGALSGQVSMTAVITAVVQNIASNYEGVVLNNTAALDLSRRWATLQQQQLGQRDRDRAFPAHRQTLCHVKCVPCAAVRGQLQRRQQRRLDDRGYGVERFQQYIRPERQRNQPPGNGGQFQRHKLQPVSDAVFHRRQRRSGADLPVPGSE